MRPVGDQADLDLIAAWLMPDQDNRRLSNVIRSRFDATRHTRKIAVELLRDLRSSAASPTLRDAQDQLDRIRDAATALDRMLAGVSGPHGLARVVALECAFFRQRGAEYESVDWDDVLSKPLRTLAETARQYRAELTNSAASGPGRQRLHERLFGDPRLRFGWSCTLLLRECRCGEEGPVPTTEAVLDLMQKVWAYAIGDAPPDDFLEHEAEAGAKAVRNDLPLRRENNRLIGLMRPKNDI